MVVVVVDAIQHISLINNNEVVIDRSFVAAFILLYLFSHRLLIDSFYRRQNTLKIFNKCESRDMNSGSRIR